MAVQSTPNPSQVPKRRKTIRFGGFIGKQELSILLDSGSSSTFISEYVAQGCKSQLKPCSELQFVAADGLPMVSNQYIPGFQWFIQGQSFSYDVRVLPLKCYDMILGANWLEDHSPTCIHWKRSK
jgi:hypothetical protein